MSKITPNNNGTGNIKLGLERITELCGRIGDPQDKTKIIHIAGTNGKGSFSAILSEILKECGYTAGSFSSPSITDISDCFRLNGTVISYDELSDTLGILAPHAEAMNDPPTEFESLTAAAYLFFLRNKCDIALVECGMGGDTDATNIIDSPLLSVITDISSDHTAFLGSTIKEIARHKAGIIKQGRPVLYSGNDPEALEVITETANKMNAPLTITDKDSLSAVNHDIHGIEFRHERLGTFRSQIIGTYQVNNIANVLSAVEILRKEGMDIPDSCIISGIAKARWHGRFELLSESPLIVFDGAHNPDGIVRAAESIEKYFNSKIALLIGVMADKEYQLYPELLGKYVSKAFAVTPATSRALNSRFLAEAFTEHGIPATFFDSMKDGIGQALEYAKKNKIPLVALGSLYLYSSFTDTLKYVFHVDIRNDGRN